ncbi:hypothetical protein BTS2_3058 [Bacillus sp. TS-2]|nr:hypothetical protein BTS2_3058 [Bacillus sp. TS-2]
MNEPFKRYHTQYLLIEPWLQQNKSILAGFTTRHGGVSQGSFHSLNMGFHVSDEEQSVLDNRQLVSDSLSFPLENWVGSEQIHKATICKVKKDDQGRGATSLHTAIEATDGLYTNESNVLLTSLYADCVPLYFWCEPKGLIGLAHAGWKGTVLGIGEKMIQTWLTEEKVAIEDIQVAIGPCISQTAYEVDLTLFEQIQKKYGQELTNKVMIHHRSDHYLLDLRLLNKLILLESFKLREEQMTLSLYCTYEDDLFFSHRRDKGKSGRMMSFIGQRD